jgi:signal transduction histidine kinase
MSSEILARAGTPFFTTRTGGTGLGLSQCRRLLEGAGGSLRIESTTDRGTTVICVLPRAG